MIRNVPVNWSKGNEHPAKTVYGEVSEIMSDLGYDNNLMQELSEPRLGEDIGITLDVSKRVSELIRNYRFPFSLERDLEGYFGESEGSSNVTTQKIRKQWNLTEVLSFLKQTGQLEDALEMIEHVRDPDDPDAVTILVYAIATYAKGWLAEQTLNQTDWFSKGSTSQDEGGIDGYVDGEPAQVGSITRINSRSNSKIEGSDRLELFYHWHNGELVVASYDDWKKMNGHVAKDAGLSKTLIRKSVGNLSANDEVGRSFRYLWW